MKSMLAFFSNLTVKKRLMLTSMPVISVLISMKTAIYGLWILITLDLITGVGRSLRDRGIKIGFNKTFALTIRSYLLRETWKKFYEYLIGIVAIVVFESIILGEVPIELVGKRFTLSELAVLFPAGIELWSIFENMEDISHTNILKKLKYLLPSGLKKFFEKVDEEEK